MTYTEMSTVPAYERANWNGKGFQEPEPGNVLWGSDDAPPAIGERIVITMNRCGPAVVTGYFTQDGFLGIRCKLLAPPEWHVRQNKGNPNGHVFGPEFRRDDQAAA